MDYSRYVLFLKWLTLVLFAYVVALFIIHVPWEEALLDCSYPTSPGTCILNNPSSYLRHDDIALLVFCRLARG